METLPLAAALGIFEILIVIVIAVAVVGAAFVGIGRATRREDREGNVHPPDDPQSRPPRA